MDVPPQTRECGAILDFRRAHFRTWRPRRERIAPSEDFADLGSGSGPRGEPPESENRRFPPTQVLNLPGSVSGSYSRNLNHLWFLGSVVASWESPAVEFYYPALTPGVTHVAVNRTTAAAAFAALRDADAARLRANARRVADELLCPDCLADYWRLVLCGIPPLVLGYPKNSSKISTAVKSNSFPTILGPFVFAPRVLDD